mmetsp:Transcript_43287/g.135503  ORF Transcript_43287/g.135503 Transcript_43287/m.135503 type:complete len:152 (+) Transcript_43287:376-831(+)
MHVIVLVIGLLGASLTVWAFTMTACADPGIVYRRRAGQRASHRSRAVSPEEPQLSTDYSSRTSMRRDDDELLRLGYTMCSICEVPRPPGAQHCYDCDVCVEDLDHHCPWSGKCIGRRNLVYFRAFLALLTFHIVFVICVTGVQLANGEPVT